MRLALLLLPLVASVVADLVEEPELPLAEPCDEEKCQLPSCRCSSVSIPGGLQARDTPQFVLLTFDNAVDTINTATYRNLLYWRTNSNQCKAGATFFINHEYSDYTLINELYNQGYEIGLKSISHQTPQDYWRDADYETLMAEFADQKKMMAHFANIPESAITGMRSPFLQMAGNETYKVLASAGLTYDSSWSTIAYTDPGLWPYTLDYESIQDCVTAPCPTASVPGAWVVPMIAWFDLLNIPCAMASSCFAPPDYEDEEAWFKFMVTNFERHYLSNRAPFGLFFNEWFIRAYPPVQRAFVRFLDLINELNDTFMVSAKDVLEWVRDPIPIDEYRKKPCKTVQEAACRSTLCGPLSASHTELVYYMSQCNQCPSVYPWVGNPYGL
ncbi:chitin deacetylase 8-like [Aricia agestis]|uniref:chitin deacetylase 8-like n=1 Tax=Aricia agestis TaxID=91739 RepID=UPI001C208925|nr:chitin deacetylase 8-like [Aricia agestis]